MTLSHDIMYLTQLYVIQCMNTDIQNVLYVLFTLESIFKYNIITLSPCKSPLCTHFCLFSL